MGKFETAIQITKIILGLIALYFLWKLVGNVCIIQQNVLI